MEYFNIVDEFGQSIKNKVERHLTHKKGYWHEVIHIWIYNSKNQILIQKRSKNSEIYPNVWDVSCAGHIHFDELPLDACKRELKEELGLKLNKKNLVKIGVTKTSCKYKDLKENLFQHVFLLKCNEIPYKLQKEEVSNIKYISLKEFKKLANKPKLFFPKQKGYFDFLIANINEILK